MTRQSKKKLGIKKIVVVLAMICVAAVFISGVTFFVRKDSKDTTVEVNAVEMTFSAEADQHVTVPSERPEVDPTEDTTVDDGQVLAQPAADGPVIGYLEKDTKVNRYGEASEEGFYTISYNGRIGYISSTVFEAEEEVEEDDTTADADTTSTTGTTSASGRNTAENSNSASTPSSNAASTTTNTNTDSSAGSFSTPSAADNSASTNSGSSMDASGSTSGTTSGSSTTIGDGAQSTVTVADDEDPEGHVFIEP